MFYIYVDNYRGFSDLTLPLKQVNFLVGENSTGKSSLLKLIRLFMSPEFWISPARTIQEIEPDLAVFKDVVSKNSDIKFFFKVGLIYSEIKNGNQKISFSIFKFTNHADSVFLKRYIRYSDNSILKLEFTKTLPKFKLYKTDNLENSEDGVLNLFKKTISEDTVDNTGFITFPKGMANPPLSIAISIAESLLTSKDIKWNEFRATFPFSLNNSWIAPIRSKPHRIYDGMNLSFTPEGEHAPFVLRKNLKSKSSSEKFRLDIETFGVESRLFDSIKAHSYGKSMQSPFEILVEISNSTVNINNVGYGVSQVLPLVVDFLSQKRSTNFVVQQPEVHLHPKAQASLGDLVANIAREEGHSFFLETHSDFMIDRFRMNLKFNEKKVETQVLFFTRNEYGNSACVIDIAENGKYINVPAGYKDFFIKEEFNLLGV
jgi:predicted ATP-dependent endonuclease of OLD family